MKKKTFYEKYTSIFNDLENEKHIQRKLRYYSPEYRESLKREIKLLDKKERMFNNLLNQE